MKAKIASWQLVANENKDLRKPDAERDYNNSFVYFGEMKIPNQIYGQGDQTELGHNIQASENLPPQELRDEA